MTSFKSPILSFFHFSSLVIHLPPHRTPSEAQINSMCHQDSRIFLCGYFDENKGEVTPINSPTLSCFHSPSPITLFGWHITHLSPHGPWSEVQINSTYHQDSQIFLWECFDKYKGEVIPLKSSILSFFHPSYRITLFGWHLTHPTPQGPLSEA